MTICSVDDNKNLSVLFSPDIFCAQEVGGISRYFSNLISALGTSNLVDVNVWAPLNRSSFLPKTKDKKLRRLKIATLPRGERYILPLRQAFARTSMQVFAKKPNIVHETYYSTHAFYRVPTALTFYDLIPESLGVAKEQLRPRKKAVNSANIIFCISEDTQRRLIEYYNVDVQKTMVTPLGSSLVEVPPIKPKDLFLDGAPFALFVGNRAGYKNFSYFVEAMTRTDFFLGGGRVVVAGGGKWQPEEKSLLAKFGWQDPRIVNISPNDHELTYLYKNASFYSCTSLDEGFGLPTLEAMSLGCPVVVSNIGALREVAGPAGFYIDPRNVESFVQQVNSLLGSDVIMKAKLALGEVQARKFSWEYCASQTTLGYHRAVKSIE